MKIGNLYWTTENFKEDVGSAYCKYNGMPDQDKYGMYYIWEGWSSRNLFPEMYEQGWRFPSEDDYKNLINSSNVESLLEGGHSGFNAKLAGVFSVLGEFIRFGEKCYYWSSTTGNYVDQKCFTLSKDGSYETDNFVNKTKSFAQLRLCKDA